MSFALVVSLVSMTCYLYRNQDISLTSGDGEATLVLDDVNLKPGKASLTTSFGCSFNVRDLVKYSDSVKHNVNYVASYGNDDDNSLLIVGGHFFLSSMNTENSIVDLHRGQILFGQKGKYSINIPRESLNLTRYFDNNLEKFCFMSSFKYDKSFFYNTTSEVSAFFKKYNSENLKTVDDLNFTIRVFDEVNQSYFSEDEFTMTLSIEESMYVKEIVLFGVDPDQSVIVEL